MSALQNIIKWIHLHEMKLGVKPKVVPISSPEMMEVFSDYSTYVDICNGKTQIWGIDVEESPWAEMTRHKILEIGVERFSMEQRVDESRFRISQHKDEYTGHLVKRLTAEILTDITHLNVSFDWDRLAWLKRRMKSIGRKWPIKRKSVHIEGKVLYPYLKIQAPSDTHKVRFLVQQ